MSESSERSATRGRTPPPSSDRSGDLARIAADLRRGSNGRANRALLAWMGRELDAEGVPQALPVSCWLQGLECLAEIIRDGKDEGLDRVEALAEGWFLGLLRLTRSDGSPVFGDPGSEKKAKALLRFWADRLPDPGYSTVLDWWFPTKVSRPHAPPPLPADCRPDRPLAILRADWRKGGDFLAIDHRDRQSSSRVELCVDGRAWIGPTWSSPGSSAGISRPRPTLWRTQSAADVVEWSHRRGKARVIRTAVFLRGRSLALLGEQWEGPDDPGSWTVELPSEVEPLPREAASGLRLRSRRSRRVLLCIPLGIAMNQGVDRRDALLAEPGQLVLSQSSDARRAWRPMLLSWDTARDRKPITWRSLTVTQDRRVCRPDEAFAVRVTWGRAETLLVYRSLARPATRSFLGHQTNARFLVALFNQQGEVEPLLRVES